MYLSLRTKMSKRSVFYFILQDGFINTTMINSHLHEKTKQHCKTRGKYVNFFLKSISKCISKDYFVSFSLKPANQIRAFQTENVLSGFVSSFHQMFIKHTVGVPLENFKITFQLYFHFKKK